MPYLILTETVKAVTKILLSHKIVLSERNAQNDFWRKHMNNNCLCHIFDDNNCTWIIILAIVIVFCCCCNNH